MLANSGTKRSEGLTCYDVLHYLANLVNPQTYLEIGVREGASLCCVLALEKEIIELVIHTVVEGEVQLNGDIVKRINEAYTPRKNISIYLFDNWSYLHGEGAHERINSLLLEGFGLPRRNWQIHDGDSKETIPKFFKEHPEKFDLMFVDGDHTAEGAKADLENVHGHYRVMVFDDLFHPQHGYLLKTFKDYTREHDVPHFIVGRNGLGVGVAFDL